MAKGPKEYQRLPGYGTRFDGVRWLAGRRLISTLWLGKDHLLRIDRASYTEEYKRFYYRDIQAFFIHRTDRRRTWNIVLILLASLFFFAGFSIDDRSGVALAILGGMGVLVAIIALVNTLLGPTCDSFIRTAVQYEQLPSWNRLRTVKKILPLIKARIEEAQGTLGVEGVKAGVESVQALEAQASAAGGFARVPAATGSGMLKHYESRMHLFVFLALLCEGLITVAQIFFPSMAMSVVSTLWSFGVGGLIIIALVKQYQTDLRAAVRGCTWAALGLIGIEFVFGYISGIALAVQNPAQYNDEMDVLRRMSELSPLETPWLLAAMTLFAVSAAVIGALGLYFLRPFSNKTTSVTGNAEPAAAQVPPMT